MSDHLRRRTVLAGLTATLANADRALAQPTVPGRPNPSELRAVLQRTRLAPDGPEVELWRFEGFEAGPVLRVRHGEELRVALRNETPAPLSLHWQGVRGPNGQDGVAGLTQPAVAPGAVSEIRFTPPDAGTFLIRPLVPGRSGELAGRGLAGLLLVEERAPPAVDADHALLVRDWLTQPTGALAPFGGRREAALGGRLGNRLVVDGIDAPKRLALPPGSRLRLRLVNGCNARIMRVRFDGLKVFVAAVDGQPTDTFEPLRASLPFPPGTRYDLLLDVPAEPGAKGAVTALVGAGLPLVEVVAEGAGVAAKPPVAALPPNAALPPEIRLQNAVRRTVAITGGASRGAGGEVVLPEPGQPVWKVGGVAGSAAAPPLLTARRGQPVVIGLVNQTAFPQPLHLHGHVVRLLHPLDDGWEPYWLDTVQVPEGRTIHIAFLADNPGRWMLGSTVLERLDAGLWTWLEIT